MKVKISDPIAIVQRGKRDNQEDSIFPQENDATAEDCCFIVCDGMGGHERGEVASAAVAEALGRYVADNYPGQCDFAEDDFTKALDVAYDALDAIADDNVGESRQPGTTLTFLKLHSQGIMLAHIGDSRIYHISPSRNVICRTRDHSVVEDLYRMGEIEEHQMRTHPRRNIITKVMQPRQEEEDGRTKATISNITNIVEGDYFMLCSDGIVERHSDDVFLDVFSDGSLTDEQKARRIEELTADNSDNHCAYIIKITDVEGAEVRKFEKLSISEKTGSNKYTRILILIAWAFAALILVIYAFHYMMKFII